MEKLDWPQFPEFETFLDEQTLLPAGWLTPSDEEDDDDDDEVGDADGVGDAVGGGNGVDDEDERRLRLVKTGNMRRGGIGETGVFPREYQSRTSALPPAPENVTSSKKMGHLLA